MRGSRWAVAVLVAVPVLAFTLPSLAGHVPVNGDNPIQAYPLRVLAGHILAQGHLPLWNPYDWSGSPLLAGFNAGALFPATLLFAVLPPLAAWVITEVLVYVVCATGFFAFMRVTGRSVGASLLAAASFSFAGFMSSQLGHIDLVQAAALAPWMLLALHRLAWPRRLDDRGWRWALLLGASFALVILSGDPEAVLDTAILAGIYALTLAAAPTGRRGRLLGLAALALAWGVAAGAAQWLPGLAFTAQSQRSAASYAFFSSGSLPAPLAILLLVPFLLGGYQRLGQPLYFGPYNLAELNAYVGILPVMAGFALLVRRRHRPAPPVWAWYLIVAAGLVLALGSHTPAGHLLHQVPYYGQQRTQSRNLLDVDVGLAALLAVWVDQLVGPAGAPGGPGLVPAGGLGRLSGLLALVPVAVVAATWALVAAAPRPVARALGAGTLPAGAGAGMDRYLTELLAVAVGAGVVVFLIRGWPRNRRLVALGAVLVADLGLFAASQYTFAGLPDSVLTGSSPPALALARATGPSGRFLLYDPAPAREGLLYAAGTPDLNVMDRSSSVDGYGSLVGRRYAGATGLHEGGLAVAALAGSTFDRLDLRTLATGPGSFAVPAPPTPSAGSGTAKGTTAGPSPAAGPRSVAPGRQSWWFLGSVRDVSAVVLADQPPTTVANPGNATQLEVGLSGPDGSVTWSTAGLSPDGPGTETVTFPRPVPAVAVVVANATSGAQVVSAPQVRATTGAWTLDGPLSDVVTYPHWRWVGRAGDLALLRDTRARGLSWVQSPGGEPVRGATSKLVGQTAWGAQTMRVATPEPAVLVRSVADSPGWSATIRRPDGRARPVPVRRSGLIQQVRVPAGTWLVTWSYRPSSVVEGGAVSVASVVAAAALAFGLEARRRPRRPPAPAPVSRHQMLRSRRGASPQWLSHRSAGSLGPP